jgi:hypothetical protein
VVVTVACRDGGVAMVPDGGHALWPGWCVGAGWLRIHGGVVVMDGCGGDVEVVARPWS